MKKILIMLSAIVPIISASTSVIACGQAIAGFNGGNKETTVKNLSQLRTYEVDLNNEESVWTNVQIAIQKKLQALFPDQEIEPNIDYKIETPDLSEETGKPNFVGFAKVQAVPTSRFLIGEFNILIKKDLSEILSNDFLFPKKGSKKLGEEILTKIIIEVEKWYPTAKKDIDYKIYGESELGSWSIQSTNNLITFNFSFDVALSRVNIEGFKNYEVDLGSEDAIWTNVQIAIHEKLQALFLDQEIQPNIDYKIETPDLNEETGKPNFVGFAKVQAVPTSRFLIGEFNILIKKDLSEILSNDFLFPKKGTKQLGEQVLAKIVAEMKKWMPNLKETDYSITNEFGFFKIQSKNYFVTFINFLFSNIDVVSISKLEPSNSATMQSNLIFNIDDKDLNRNKIETTVNDEINKFFKADQVELGTDYQIESIPYDSNDRPTQAGRYLVLAQPHSKLIKGKFNLIIQKDLSEILNNDSLFPKKGSEELGEEVLSKIIIEIKKWYPNAKKDIDYSIIKNDNDPNNRFWIVLATWYSPIYFNINLDGSFKFEIEK